MPLIKNTEITDDDWIHVADDEPISSDRPSIISYNRWRESQEELSRHNGPLGIQLKSDQAPELIERELDRFDLVALEFPNLNDGRAFSYASLLRQRYGFKGEIRAVGRVIQDQLYFMQRCGFDCYELSEDQDARKAIKAFDSFSAVYQPAADGRPPAYRKRFEQI